MRKTSIERICENCGKTFLIQPYRLKESGNPGRFCTMSCRNKEGGWSPGRDHRSDIPDEQLVAAYLAGENTPAIAERYGMTKEGIAYRLKRAGVVMRKPTGSALRNPEVQKKAAANHVKGERNHNYRHLPDEEICKAYREGVSSEELAKRYQTTAGTILIRIRKAGIKVQRQGFCRKRRCSDGHVVDSRWEQAVDEWLTAHKIPHEIQPYAPWYRGGKSPQRADFLANGTYIEVWGIEGNAQYDANRLSKVAKYKDCGAKLIQVFPHHILDNDLSLLDVLLE